MDSLSRLPLYLQVKNYITSMIDSGDYPADSKLPTEKELMKTLGVGRATVRSALSELEHDGRIYKRHGVGTFVSSNKWMPAFEPIISLTYSLERLGMEIRNVIISSGLEYPKDELAKNFPQDKKIGRLSRLRLAGGETVAVEDSYFTEELYNTVRSLDPDKSVAHAILDSDGVDVDRIDMKIVLRMPTAKEQKQLKLAPGERVAQLTRWTFSADKAINYVRFVMRERLVQTPFGGRFVYIGHLAR